MTTHNPTGRPGWSTMGLFAMAVTLGGANFLGVRVSNRELDPLWGAGLRFGVAAVLFAAIALWLRLPVPRGRMLALTMAYGVMTFGLFYALMYWALTVVTAGSATVVLAVVPLVTTLLAVVHRLERLHPRALLGSVLALSGIAWMSIGPSGMVLPAAALAAMAAAALCVGESVILGKRISGNHPAMTNAVGLATGAVVLLALSAGAGESWVLPSQGSVVLAVAYLVTLGSVGLFVLTLLVIRAWTPSATSYMFVLFPVVTMVLESVLTGEPVTLRGTVGAALVMAGVWFGALAGARGRPAPRSTEAGRPVTASH